MDNSNKLTRVIACVLTVAFLGFVLAVTAFSLLRGGGAIWEATNSKDALKNYEKNPENPSPLDRLQARIPTFTSAIADNIWLKEEFGYVNSRFQLALGKRMINTGTQNMVRLNTGHLYDLQPYKPLQDAAQEIIDLRGDAFAGLPFLFVYEHPTLYDDSMMPEEYAALDDSTRMADEVTSMLRAGGIDVIDSRDVLPRSPYALDDLLMVTDQHWSTLAAIAMAQNIAEHLRDALGAPLDPSLLDMDSMNTLVHPKLFLGRYGQRLGASIVDPDDIVEYWPKYDTQISRSVMYTTSMEEASGDFRTAVTRADRLLPEEGKTYNTYAYTYYGQAEAYAILQNPNAPDYTVLILKDSYSSPIATFLSLTARTVVGLDLRKDAGKLEDWMEKYPPDVVIVAYSLQMLKDENYAFN